MEGYTRQNSEFGTITTTTVQVSGLRRFVEDMVGDATLEFKMVLEAIERKSTKSCEKVGKSAKSGTEVLRVREEFSVREVFKDPLWNILEEADLEIWGSLSVSRREAAASQSRKVKNKQSFPQQSTEVGTTSSATEVCRCGPQHTALLPLQKQTAPKFVLNNLTVSSGKNDTRIFLNYIAFDQENPQKAVEKLSVTHRKAVVYMTPLPGVSLPPGHVYRLRKALYGLKQAHRAWFEKFSSTVISLGFSASNYDSGLFTRTTDSGTILLPLYVDDMIITGNDLAGIAQLKQALHSKFEMKDLGKVHYFLGLEVLLDTADTYLCQSKYTLDLLSKAGITDSKVASTPLENNLHLAPNAGPPQWDPTLYRQLVGSLIYLTVTRPDITYVVHVVSQFMLAPCSDHYAVGTMFHGLYFSSTSSLILRGFSDADWDSDITDRRSTTRYCFFVGDSLISWRSKKRSLTSRSITEAEYRALADTSQELIWLRWLLFDICTSQQSPTSLWCDNTSAIQIAHNDVFHERTKHIEIDCHFVQQHVLLNTIQLQPVSTDDQPADIFTKAHLPGRFRELVSKLNLGPSSPD
ncbi:hypothetical protein OSB04_025248 [Centaurea solstitialis]|uniref:Reverse transcriptase Ty1/copia-type domain-containing protein n=1 Tax=Centaurea solstitialis TaxID=347529 RepID=A0AA38WEM7_9ASTR|nr:hypothetical protein OSB04_025248 [Centaurea solstitialis]